MLRLINIFTTHVSTVPRRNRAIKFLFRIRCIIIIITSTYISTSLFRVAQLVQFCSALISLISRNVTYYHGNG